MAVSQEVIDEIKEIERKQAIKIRELEELQQLKKDYEGKIQKKLEADEDYFYGALRGVSDIDQLRDFLTRNEDWIKSFMGWPID